MKGAPPAIPAPPDVAAMMDALAGRVGSFDRGAVQTAMGLFDFSGRAARAFEGHFARYGLSQGRFLVLLVLLLEPEQQWTPARLAERGRVSRATMTSLLDTLQRNGAVARAPFPGDRRRNRIQLTAKGRKRIEAMLPDHLRRVGEAFAVLAGRERTQLGALLGKVAGILTTLTQEA